MIAVVTFAFWLWMVGGVICWLVAIGSVFRLARKCRFSLQEMVKLNMTDFRWFFFGGIGFMVCVVVAILSSLP
jgi:hypothetical protein